MGGNSEVLKAPLSGRGEMMQHLPPIRDREGSVEREGCLTGAELLLKEVRSPGRLCRLGARGGDKFAHLTLLLPLIS